MKITKLLGALVLFAATMVSCTFDQVEPERADADDGGTGDPVEFAAKIQPIFTSKCISCHPPTQNLDLTVGNAYNSINTSKYIDKDNADQSLIYVYPNPANTVDHPYRKYSNKEAALMLQWIKEGAQNN